MMLIIPVSIHSVSVHSGCCHNVPQTGWLKKNRTCFSRVWRLGIRAQRAGMVEFWRGPSPGLQTAVFPQELCTTLQATGLSWASFIRVLSPAPHLYPPNASSWDLGFQHINFGRIHIQSMAPSFNQSVCIEYHLLARHTSAGTPCD